MRLQGKSAWVTGAGSGIGAKIAEIFASEGADIAINDINLEGAQCTADIVRGMGRQALVVPGDVTDEDAMKTSVETIVDTFGKLDILVNNAGIAPRSWFHEMSAQQFDTMMKVHAYGLFNCTRPAIGHMVDRKYGRIIVISSLSALQGDPMMVHYSSAKSAQIGFAKALSREVASHGVTVNCVVPGLTLTPILEGLEQRHLDAYAPPVGRLGMPEDQAYAALYFASDEASFVTGQALVVAGGVG